jgi:hypothetical protein
MNKTAIKNFLGEIPLSAEAYWLLRQRGKPLNKGFNLGRLQNHLPEWKQQAQVAADQNRSKNNTRILIFAALRYWIEHAVLLGMGLSGLGNDVTLAYMPYANWQKHLNRFDMRRQELYAQSILSQAEPVMHSVSFSEGKYNLQRDALPEKLAQSIEDVSFRDVQYTLQVEEVDHKSDLFKLRLERNKQAARALLQWITKNGPPQVILTPNGSILEMGAIYAVARHMDITVVTYEFGEQRDRIWLAHNNEVMLQDTGDLWQVNRYHSLSDAQWQVIQNLYAARKGASLWSNFSRLWQGQPLQGGETVRQELKLDERPVVLLAANVIGDSLTLGRQVFSESMTEWLAKSIAYFKDRKDVQLVIRIHPGEKYTKGPSVANIVRRVCPSGSDASLPEHFRLVEANDPTNTYDIADIAQLGLVYTTTTGMEMAMNGLPVIVAGKTHYRERGFTLDPNSWDAYFDQIEQVLDNPPAWRLDEPAIRMAWQYAYHFFFTYPLPFPWHLLYFWQELPDHPLSRVLTDQGQLQYGSAFRCLAGEPRQWAETVQIEESARSSL